MVAKKSPNCVLGGRGLDALVPLCSTLVDSPSVTLGGKVPATDFSQVTGLTRFAQPGWDYARLDRHGHHESRP
jgi:hypothetical protein